MTDKDEHRRRMREIEAVAVRLEALLAQLKLAAGMAGHMLVEYCDARERQGAGDDPMRIESRNALRQTAAEVAERWGSRRGESGFGTK